MGIQIFLRATIKTEFMFTEYLTPIDLMNYYNLAMEIEQKKIDEIEASKREQYLK